MQFQLPLLSASQPTCQTHSVDDVIIKGNYIKLLFWWAICKEKVENRALAKLGHFFEKPLIRNKIFARFGCCLKSVEVDMALPAIRQIYLVVSFVILQCNTWTMHVYA